MSFRLLLLAASVLALAFAPAPFPRTGRDSRNSVLNSMQGWWAQAAEREKGQAGTPFGLRVHISDKSLQFYINQTPADAWNVSVDPTTTPASMDMVRKGTTNDKLLARVSASGDTLVISFAATKRPRDLSGNAARAITFKREQK